LEGACIFVRISWERVSVILGVGSDSELTMRKREGGMGRGGIEDVLEDGGGASCALDTLLFGLCDW
jgi:hypothetical protein